AVAPATLVFKALSKNPPAKLSQYFIAESAMLNDPAWTLTSLITPSKSTSAVLVLVIALAVAVVTAPAIPAVAAPSKGSSVVLVLLIARAVAVIAPAAPAPAAAESAPPAVAAPAPAAATAPSKGTSAELVLLMARAVAAPRTPNWVLIVGASIVLPCHRVAIIALMLSPALCHMVVFAALIAA
ncbi:MAG: hypothetical protein LBF49_00665, partial [Puniceicoccales bacterium]|nr:hypothetical protein [Puniceicoccales bacterium]